MSTNVNKAISEKARGFGGAVVEHLAVEECSRGHHVHPAVLFCLVLRCTDCRLDGIQAS